jgi:predicted GIY-YIG superfamily endonuclease
MIKLIDLSTLTQLNPKDWFVYYLQSDASKRSYVGMSCDVLRRLRQHNGEIHGGAKYTTQGRPWKIVMVLGPYPTRVIGCRVEWRAKRFVGDERFKYRKWVAELDDNAADKDRHLHKYKRRRKKK